MVIKSIACCWSHCVCGLEVWDISMCYEQGTHSGVLCPTILCFPEDPVGVSVVVGRPDASLTVTSCPWSQFTC